MRPLPHSKTNAQSGATRLLVATGLALLVLGASTALAADPFLRRTATVDVVQRVGPSVVNITTERVSETPSPFRVPASISDPFFEGFFEQFFEPRRSQTFQSLGSGVIFDREGHVLTNEHVIARASRVRVAIGDGREFEAEVVGADPHNDLAVLRILMDQKETLPFTRPGSSADLMVGEPVIAIGNPFGFSSSVTTGVISAVNRSVNTQGGPPFHGLLQTDASINPGNSGGPLLNAEGRLIGINVAIYGGAQGIGFAIPIDMARRVIHELLLYGEVHPVWLGLEFQDIDPALREVLGVPQAGGALVHRVQPGSPASRAGIQRGDVIVGVDERPLLQAADLNDTLWRMTNGQRVRFTLFRDDTTLDASATAEEMPPSVVSRLAFGLLGIDLSLSERDAVYAVEDVRKESAAAALGLRSGDLILRVNGVALTDPESLRRAIARLRGAHRALVVVQRGPGRYHLTIPLQR
jgi:Do/DeqQ family serine protease